MLSQLINTRVPQLFPFPPWVSGRFYETVQSIQTTNTSSIADEAGFMLFCNPNVVTITSIGIDVTVAGGAGSSIRFALYESDDLGIPTNLILDAGAVATDGGTGFTSVSISQLMHPQWFWVAYANESVTSNPTMQRISSSSMAYWLASTHPPTLTGSPGSGIRPAATYANLWQAIGFPDQAPRVVAGANYPIVTDNNILRVRVGV